MANNRESQEKKWLKEERMYKFIKKIIYKKINDFYNVELSINELKNVNEPYLLIGNHVLAYDPILIGVNTKIPIRFITSDTNYDTFWKKILLEKVGSIRFSKGNSDIRAIKELIRIAGSGRPVALYPEGGRNWNGKTDKIIYSTAKLIKTLKIPVYKAMTFGGYLTNPRWAKHHRKGETLINITLFLDSDEIIQMTDKEIYEKLVTELEHNEYEWQMKNMIEFNGENRAEYIQRLIYYCPNCEKIDTIKSKGNFFKCTECGETWEIDKYGFIKGRYFNNTVDWDEWQKIKIANEFTNEKFEIETRSIRIMKFENNMRTFNEKANIIVNKTGILIGNNHFNETLQFTELKAISITLADIFEFYNKENIKYRIIFNPEDNASIILFFDTLKYFRGEI